jgi:hypothetical protein
MRNPKEADDELRDLEAGQQAVQRQVTGGPVTGLNRFQRQGVRNQWVGAENQRRQQAAGNAFGLSNQIDERNANVQNTLTDAYSKYRNVNADAAQQQAQTSLTLGQNVKESMAGLEQKKNEFDFGLFKNQAERDDAMASLWRKGVAEEALQNMAFNHQLKMQDVDQYFKLLINQLNEDLEDYKIDSQIGWSKTQRGMESAAANTGLLMGGLGGVAGAVIGWYAGGPTGAAYGVGAGAAIGTGIGKASEAQ